MPLFDTALTRCTEIEARLRLHHVPDIGSQRFHKLIAAFGTAVDALQAPASGWRALGLPNSATNARSDPEIIRAATAAMAWLERSGQHLLMWDQPEYPALLAEIADPPPLLWVAGEPALLDKPQLAIVGSRRASPPGLDNARSFARSLAKAGFVITSGLALGIDGAAHQAALDVDGRTIGVLGTGLEKFYPQKHRALAQAMLDHGSALVSEFPLTASAQPGNFPRRNRIISGLSLGVLVIEASPASGSLITARLAAEHGREVWALPGSIHHPGARGCHQLIRDGAQLVETIEHILEGLQGWKHVPLEVPVAPLYNDDPLLKLLIAAAHTTEALVQASGWSLPQVMTQLTELELEGRVINQAGRWFARVS
jgi:DNA processing protein